MYKVVLTTILVLFSNKRLTLAETDDSEYDPVKFFMPEPAPSLNYSPPMRIINGFEAQPNAYPYQVGIEISVTGGWTWCGGSLISQNFVLTAAHCLDSAFYVNVLLSVHDRVDTTEAGRIKMYVPPSNFIIHQSWDRPSLTNDIALIRLTSTITYTDKIQPIALPTRAYAYNTFEGSPAITTGWGYLKGTSSLSRYLQYADVIIMETNRCRSYLRQVTSNHICIDGSYGKGVCYGDSGSSMVTTSGQKFLIGITSFVSASGCEINYPSVFTRVTSFLDWISSKTGIIIP